MEYISLGRFAFAFVLVLSLIGLMALVLRRYAAARGWQMDASAPKRLRMLEVLPLSSQQRLVLVQRDDTTHLLAISPNSVQLVEQHIVSPTANVAEVHETKTSKGARHVA